MTCYLLHIMEDPDRDAYRDPDLKDVVGLMPRFFCAQCEPLKPLLASESVKCMRRNAPCWKPAGTICDDVPGQSRSSEGATSEGPSPEEPPAPDSSRYTF